MRASNASATSTLIRPMDETKSRHSGAESPQCTELSSRDYVLVNAFEKRRRFVRGGPRQRGAAKAPLRPDRRDCVDDGGGELGMALRCATENRQALPQLRSVDTIVL
jgi:hypothetical protein